MHTAVIEKFLLINVSLFVLVTSAESSSALNASSNNGLFNPCNSNSKTMQRARARARMPREVAEAALTVATVSISLAGSIRRRSTNQ